MIREAEQPQSHQNFLAHQLAMTYASTTDFTRALEMVQDVAKYDQPTTYLTIGDNLIDAGFGVVPIVDHFLSLMEGKQDQTEPIHPFLAYLYAKSGDVPQALALAQDHANSFHTQLPWDEVYLTIGILQHEAGEDPKEAFDKAIESITYLTPPAMKFMSYLQTATVQFTAGQDPQEALARAELARAYAKKTKNHDTLQCIQAQVACGNMIEARRLLTTLQPETDPTVITYYQNAAYQHMAKGYLKQGNLSQALNCGMQATDPHIKTEVLTAIALQSAEKNIPQSVLFIKEALLSRIDTLRPLEQVRSLANLAYALAKIKDDEEEQIFAQALTRTVVLEDAHEKARAYMAIGDYQAKAKQDGQAMYTAAVEAVEMMTEQPSLVIHDIDITREQQNEVYADIALEAISHGYLNFAEAVLPRITNPAYRAECLSEIARMKADFALSIEEIEMISPADIKKLLQGDNELAKQAIVYFGLDKKVA